MSLWREVRAVFRLDVGQKAAWFTTFAAIVFVDLTIAVGLVLAMAVLLYALRDSVSEARSRPRGDFQEFQSLPFATILRDSSQLSRIQLSRCPPILILPISEIGKMDERGLEALITLGAQIKNSGRTLILSGTRPQRTSVNRSR